MPRVMWYSRSTAPRQRGQICLAKSAERRATHGMRAPQRCDVDTLDLIESGKHSAAASRRKCQYERRLRLSQKTADRAVVDRCTDGAAVLMAISGNHGPVTAVVMTAMAVCVHIIVRMGMRRAKGANTAWAIVLAEPNAVEAVAQHTGGAVGRQKHPSQPAVRARIASAAYHRNAIILTIFTSGK